MDIIQSGLYVIADSFFQEFNGLGLKGNKDDKRPHYYCLKMDNLLWMIPITSKYDKYKRLYDIEMEKRYRCDKFVFFKNASGEMNVFLVQDIFPIIADYIERPFTVNEVPYEIKNEKLQEEIINKAERIIKLTKRGIKFNPTQPEVLKLEAMLQAKLTEREVAPTKD